jgi:hypothetical protein
MHTATVSTPQAPEEENEEGQTMKDLNDEAAESVGKAYARKQEELAEKQYEAKQSESFLDAGKDANQPWGHNKSILSEKRPVTQQRFPSRDIWEDSPDSHHLQAEVSAPQEEETKEDHKEDLVFPEERPTTGAVVFHQEKHAAGHEMDPYEGKATTGIAAILKPSIPARPAAKAAQLDGTSPATSPVDKKKPEIPLKSKPVIPTRPVRQGSGDSSKGAPLTTVDSAGSAKSDVSAVAASKPKPPVPTRPLGSKIAALQGGFLADLNKKLGLGPQAPPKHEEPKEEEKVEEKKPLGDARKGRARGPARRAPAASAAASSSPEKKAASFGFITPATVWEVDPEDEEAWVAVASPVVKTPESEPAKEEAPEPVVEKVEEVVPEKAASAASVLPSTTDLAAPLLSAREVITATAATATQKVAETLGVATDAPAVPADELEAQDEAADPVEAEGEGDAEGDAGLLGGSVATLKAEPLTSQSEEPEPAAGVETGEVEEKTEQKTEERSAEALL